MFIALADYAKLHNRSGDTVRRLAERGVLKTAQKIGRNWVVDNAEEYPFKQKDKQKDGMICTLFTGPTS